MRVRIALVSNLAWALTFANVAAPVPHEAIARYRQFVAAIRTGDAAKAVQLIEPVPETSKPLVAASVKAKIAVEAVRKEMAAQFGPATADDESWRIGELPDELLERLEAVAEDQDTVLLTVKKPEVVAGWMVRRNGRWTVPAGLLLDLPPAPKFEEPPAEQRARMRKYADATAKAAEGVLKRLRRKEFKKNAEVQRALGEAIETAADE